MPKRRRGSADAGSGNRVQEPRSFSQRLGSDSLTQPPEWASDTMPSPQGLPEPAQRRAIVHRRSPPPELQESFEGKGYDLHHELGHGGMGVVYEATARGKKALGIPKGIRVAVKLLSEELSRDDVARERFMTEAQVVRGLAHPNIVKMYEIGEVSRRLFFVMEHLQGADLGTILHQKKRRGEVIGVADALRLIRGAAAALSFAHSNDVIHRDIKPSNIFIVKADGKEKPVLIDLGLAKLADIGAEDSPQLTKSGHFTGTPFYMAPEVIPDKSTRPEYDHRVDIYSLGVTLYEIITGRLPFEAEGLFAILLKIKTEQPERPSDKRPGLDIPKRVEDMLMRCLEKDPDKRFPDMDALIREIDACLLECEGISMSDDSMSSMPTLATNFLAGIDSDPEVVLSPYKPPARVEETGQGKPEPDIAVTPARRNLLMKAIYALTGVTLVMAGIAGYTLYKKKDGQENAKVYTARIESDIPAVPVFLEQRLESGTVDPRILGKTPLEIHLKGEQTVFLVKEGYRRAYFRLGPKNNDIRCRMRRR